MATGGHSHCWHHRKARRDQGRINPRNFPLTFGQCLPLAKLNYNSKGKGPSVTQSEDLAFTAEKRGWEGEGDRVRGAHPPPPSPCFITRASSAYIHPQHLCPYVTLAWQNPTLCVQQGDMPGHSYVTLLTYLTLNSCLQVPRRLCSLIIFP